MVKSYGNSLTYSPLGSVIEAESASEYRSVINSLLNRVEQYVSDAGLSDVYYYRAAPAAGGWQNSFQLLPNIFQLTSLGIPLQGVIDLIERTISVYESDKFSAKIRTFNPFHWLWVLIQKLSSTPFLLLTSFGFNGQKAAHSLLGRLIGLIMSVILALIAALSGIATILAAIDRQDLFKELITKL